MLLVPSLLFPVSFGMELCGVQKDEETHSFNHVDRVQAARVLGPLFVQSILAGECLVGGINFTLSMDLPLLISGICATGVVVGVSLLFLYFLCLEKQFVEKNIQCMAEKVGSSPLGQQTLKACDMGLVGARAEKYSGKYSIEFLCVEEAHQLFSFCFVLAWLAIWEDFSYAFGSVYFSYLIGLIIFQQVGLSKLYTKSPILYHSVDIAWKCIALVGMGCLFSFRIVDVVVTVFLLGDLFFSLIGWWRVFPLSQDKL